MNVLRKKRKNRIKIRLKTVILLIFSLIMTTFAWFTYSKILNTGIDLDLVSWDISFFVDKDNDNIPDPEEKQDNPISVDLSDLYPGMEDKIVKVIIKNNGETPTDIVYTSSEINILGNEYTKVETVPEDNEYYILKHDAVESEGISTLDIINEPERFPFKITVEHTQEVLSTEQGYLNIKVSWPSYGEDDTDEEKEAKDLLDTEWGYKVAKYLEDNIDNPDVTGAFHMKIRINAIGKPREGTDYDVSFATNTFSKNYGQYVSYPVDIDGNAEDYDWRIFYNDGDNVFLIADDYVNSSVLVNNEMTKFDTAPHSKYCLNFDGKLTTTLIDYDISTKYMLNEAVASTNNNYYMAAHLLNTSVWNTYFRDSAYASSAIGAPTLEMFAESWNEKFAGNDVYSEVKYGWDTDANNGYKIWLEGGEYTMKGIDTEDAKLYFPHETDTNIDGTDEGYCYGYWLAAPYYNDVDGLLSIGYDGVESYGKYDSNYLGIRPVVCLNSDIVATLKGENWRIEVVPDDTFARQIKGNEATVYGEYTNYPVDLDGDPTDNDWQVFYSDGTDVFLKADTNVMLSDISTNDFVMYNTNKYMITKANEFNSENDNYEGVNLFLNTDNWTTYVDKAYATSAIGSPTIEMWIASWNQKGYTELEVETNSNGYYVGHAGLDLAGIADQDIMEGGYMVGFLDDEAGFDDTLYFKDSSVNSELSEVTILLSPSAESTTSYLVATKFIDEENSEESLAAIAPGTLTELFNITDYIFNPVVCLRKDIKATKVDDVWQLGE